MCFKMIIHMCNNTEPLTYIAQSYNLDDNGLSMDLGNGRMVYISLAHIVMFMVETVWEAEAQKPDLWSATNAPFEPTIR